MDWLGWTATLLGTFLVLLILLDVFLAVLHLSHSGVVAPRVHRGVWRIAVALSRLFPRARRALLGFAGPLMILLGFIVWVGGFILGFALLYWPHLEHYSAPAHPLTFVDALYYSGTTGTGLGYGDISPTTAGLKVLSFVESGFGFGMLTGIVAYLLNVVGGVSERNVLAERIHGETGQSGDGVRAVIRTLRYEHVGDSRTRLEIIVRALQSFQERMRQFPILYLYYRSTEPQHDPEYVLQTMVEVALAGQIVARDERFRRLRAAAEDLGHTASQIMFLVAEEYLDREVYRHLRQPQADASDRAWVAAISRRLTGQLDTEFVAGEPDQELAPLTLAARARVLLQALEGLTAWHMDHPPRYLHPHPPGTAGN